MHKLSVEAPPKILVERYLIEIAKNYNVPYEPDAMVRVSSKESVVTQCESWKFCPLFVYLPSATSPDSLRCVLGRRQT